MNARADIVWLVSLFLTGLVLCFLMERGVISWVRRRGIAAEPNWRTVHRYPVAQLGGLAFLPTLAIGFALVFFLYPRLWHSRYAGLLAAACLIVPAGVWDDLRDMRASHKLAAQLLAGAVLYASGYRVGRFSIPFVNVVPIELGIADFFITVVGIAAIINAVNMLDGLDGLAAGSVFIMCVFLFINKLAHGALSATPVLTLTAGITLAFLWYNAYPARVFMGDTGAMLLGLILAAETFDSVSQGSAVTAILLPLVILGIPILDMLRTMITRFRISRNVFTADKNHLHHRLLSLGLSHREAVFFIYGLNVYMGIMALLYKHVAVAYRGLYLLALGLFLFMASYLVGVGHRKNGGDAEPAGPDSNGGEGPR